MGHRLSKVFTSYEQKEAPVTLNTLRNNLTRAVQAGLVQAPPSFTYTPASHIKYPDLNNRRDAKEFMNLVANKYTYLDLERATPTDLGLQAISENSERWVVFALNNGADPVRLLEVSIYTNKTMATTLMDTYHINPNGNLANGKPMLLDLQSYGAEIPEWFLNRSDVNW
ncbi:MAG: hypothetical protein MJ053_06365, partial [Elusimicrobiaceae bacterium]|nr:hypothetical protein [Elusimicrobiaceae bacterium]